MDKDKKPTKLGEILKKLNPKAIKDIAKKEKDSSYDIRKIFEELELNLISSMKRAFYFHQAEQTKEGFQWEQWQLTKLREIEKYRRKNKKLIETYNKPIQEAINRELRENYLKGQNRVSRLIDKIKQIIKLKKDPVISLPSDIEETQGIKEYIAKMMNRTIKPPNEENFFGVNDKKIEVLQQSVTNDINKANQAVLRKMDDVYRQVLFKTHVYMQAGTKTLNQAIDMATKEFLDKGINCIEYKDGKRVNIASYAEMALRTASQRATFLGEGKKRDEWGIHLVVVSAHANTCDKCLPWQGKVLIDDVFSQPSNEYISENLKQYKLLSDAMKAGLLHPNCRHTLTTFFPGITQLPTIPDENTARKNYDAEQEQRHIERQIRRWKRIKEGSLEEKNIDIAEEKVKEWEKKLREHLDNNKQLRRDYGREETKGVKADFTKYDILDNIVTEDSITIDDISRHLKEQATIREVTAKNIKEALENPLKISEITYDDLGRPSKKYIGEHATVAVNPSNGNIITTYKTSTKRAEKLRRLKGES